MNASKLLYLKDLEKLDYNAIGLLCGLEIHQQLNTGKLFSNAPCEIVKNEELNKKIHRKLRFSKSEDGNIDTAAIHAFEQDNNFTYLYNTSIATLVDLDEEPPQPLNSLALKTALQVGLLLNVNIFPQLTVMRKLIIDGSITSGFQRTAMIGMGGKLTISNSKKGDEDKKIDIYGINIEEDSARIISKEGKEHIFSLDRQGIPLIEITTGPNMKTPQEVQDTACEIGNILRSFKETRRGLGTIRQDLNVSVGVGKRVEIKGAQNFELIPQVVLCEAKRQLILHSISQECTSRGITCENVSNRDLKDVTELFKHTQSQIIQKGLQENKKVMAIRLHNMKGILGHEIQENYRFATEISNRNKKLFSSIKGLFHSDELPKYSISQDEVDAIYTALEIDAQKDAFILVVEEHSLAQKSLHYILEVIKELMEGVTEEVRQVDPKSTQTQFLRPMPGSARMYPETDIYPITLSKQYLNELSQTLPEKYDTKLKRLESEFSLPKENIETLCSKIDEEHIKELIKYCNTTAKEIYNFVIELPKDIKKRDNVEPIDFKYNLLKELLSYTTKHNLNQQTIRDIVISLYQKEISNSIIIEEFIKEHNLVEEQLSDEDLKSEIKEIISTNSNAPFGALMGMCMSKLSKRADGKKISQVLKDLMK